MALFLGSLSLLAEHWTGVLDWLDVAMLHIVPETVFGIDISHREPTKRVAPEILVLTIDSRFFETEFGGQSPISRATFTELLENVDETFHPKVLAVDYDLSPGCTHLNESDPRIQCGQWLGRDAEDQERLNAYLRSRPGQLVLIQPLPLDDQVLCQKRWDWVDETRATGAVVFGDHHLVHHGFFDTVVKYRKNPNSFARQALCNAWPQEPACVKHSAHMRGGDEPARHMDCETQPVEGKLHSLNFLPAVAGGVRICPLLRLSSVKECSEILRTDFQIVFVGSTYDASDRFPTPVETMPGVALHAYAAYSMKHPLSNRDDVALFIDVLLGTLVGVALLVSWGDRYAEQGLFARCWRAWLSFFILGTVGLGVLFAARYPMLQGWWINPGPMLIGLFVKTWHVSVTRSENKVPVQAPALGDRVVGAVYCAVWVVVVGLAVFTIIFVGEPNGSP